MVLFPARIVRIGQHMICKSIKKVILSKDMGVAGLIGGGILSEQSQSATLGVVLLVISLIVACVVWIPLVGLRVLKPQEALALTLFGKYIGTNR